ncbi:MAG: DUF4864 domain-containing protein [Marinosulfonomonas sp.]
MRRIVVGFIFVLLASLPARAQSEAVRSVIQQQVEAFQANDNARAFSFASPSLQQMFRSSDNFVAMVQRGYPMVWRPSDVEFSSLRSEQGRQFQTVIFTDQQGDRHALEYELSDAEGDWRIYSVVYLKTPDVGV